MPIGPGKYNTLCSYVRQEAEAEGVVLIVFGGKHGDGFAVQANAAITLTLPEILERAAADIRATFDRGEL
jgi:hypothetical protein